ncbi:hypothetical protein Tco_0801843 [Tanacetum coccineum]|uniref:Uncharacterized protein n=1 Tax=Tanacetum coccineum TaxID=301880 RepID=A0ABQ4ZX43_9ASTR
MITAYVLWKPSRDFARPPGPPSGLKGLFHTLNATVIPIKVYAFGISLSCSYTGDARDEVLEITHQFVHTPQDYVPTDDEMNDETKYVDEEEYERINEELYGDANVEQTQEQTTGVQEESGPEMASAQVQYVVQAIITDTPAIHNATTEVLPLSSSHSVSSTYTNAFLNLENLHSTETEVVSMLDINVQHEVPLPESETLSAPRQRITDLEKDVKELKNVDNSTTVISTIKSEVPNALKEYLRSSLDDALHKHRALNHALIESILKDKRCYGQKVLLKIKEEKTDDSDKDEAPSRTRSEDYDNAQHDDVELDNTDMPMDQGEDVVPESETLSAPRQRITDLEKDVKELKNVDNSTTVISIIKSEVSNVVKEYLGSSLDDALYKVIQKYSADIIKEHSIPAEIKTTLFNTMTKSKSFNNNPKHRALYHALMESILEDEDAMDKGVADELKNRKPDDADKDEGPTAGSDQGKYPTTSSKSGKSAKEQVKEPIFMQDFDYAKHDDAEFDNTDMPMDQGEDLGKTDEQPNDEAIPKNDWYKASRSDTSPNPEWKEDKLVNDGPEQSWLNDLAKAEKPPLTFDELMHTLIDFFAFAMNRLKIDNLTKEHLVGPVYNLLKGTCKSYVELDYTMEECYRALSEQLDWNNPEGHRYFFFNNDLEYLRGRSNDKKYTASTTKSKAARYELKGIEDMVPNLWSPVKHGVYSTKRILSIISVKVNKWYGYGHLEEIVVKRADKKLHTFKEGDFKRLHLNDIEDMLLFIVQNKLHNLDTNVVVHLAVNLLDISRRPAYTTLSNPQGVINEDKMKRKRFMCADELHKFSDGTIISVHDTLDQMLHELHLGYNTAMRSLEKFIGGRDYGEDLRLLQRTT